MSAPLLVRDATPADSAAVLAMNNAATPNVNALSETEWAWLVAHATYYRVAADAEGIAGFILCVPAGLDYWSLNYAWFTARLPDFLYL
ncbi:MAG: GNAT family N-acetyltransferase, partial [Gemmatimonadota bacterium]|nr:GNAT family N-acetyltransferase [Gemmatimonadota bacterium]